MKTKYTLLSFLTAIFSLCSIGLVHAITPTLSLSSTGSGDAVRVIVSGDPNSSIQMGYNHNTNGLSLTILGTTDSTGYFSSTVNTSTYSVSPGSATYVKVNNQQSSSVAWPTTTSSSTLTLSQTGVSITAGQSSIVTANNSSLYLSNNSNSQVANINISGSQITITGNTNGNTTATICAQGGSVCSSIYITVQSSGTQALSFSQSNLTIASGQTIPVTISGGTGLYMVSNNSNSGLVQASVSGSIINLSTNGASGSSSITVCSTNMSSCGIINVTVSTSSSSTLSFSQTNPVIQMGQNSSVVISGGGSSTYYVSSNSNTSAVQASISSNVLTLRGLSSGSAIITVCSSVNSCNTLTTTVNYVSTGGPISLSQTSLSIAIGQTVGITITGGDAPYNLPSNGGSIFQGTLNGNVLNIYGIASGSSSIPVCSAGGGCVNLGVTVNGSGSLQPVLAQNSLSLNAGQSGTVSITNNGSFYISNNTNQNIASASVSGSQITVSALNTGSTSISVCQSGGQCSILTINVAASSTSGNVSVNSTSFLSFSKSDPIVGVGASANIVISGGSGTYSVVYNSNPSISRLSISGTTMAITGSSNGTSIVVVCSSNGSACGAVSLLVGSSTTTTTQSSIKATPSSVNLKVGKAALVTFSGGSGTYSAGNNGKDIVSIAIVKNMALFIGKAVGSAIIPICNSGNCISLSVNVYKDNSVPATTKYKFTSLLYLGLEGDEVLELQKRLSSEGFFKGVLNGKFDTYTISAVRAFQAKNGIRQTGNVGDETRAALNK